MRILVTGSRDWTDEDTMFEVLLPLLPDRGSLMHTVVLVHGACPDGADDMASMIWTTNGGLEERHPAEWDKHPGRSAGYVRNAEMVALGANACLAFLMPCSKQTCTKPKPHDSHGTAMCADLARKAGIPVIEIRPR